MRKSHRKHDSALRYSVYCRLIGKRFACFLATLFAAGCVTAQSKEELQMLSLGPGEAQVQDDFSFNRLDDLSRYVRYYSDAFAVENGELVANVAPWQHALLNIFPAFGRRVRLSLDIHSPTNRAAKVRILYDWRYSPHDRHNYVELDFPSSRFYWRESDVGDCKHARFDSMGGGPVNLSIERNDYQVVFFIDGEHVGSSEISEKTSSKNVSEHRDHSGFALWVPKQHARQYAEFDNLTVEGDLSPVEWKAVSQSFHMSSFGNDYHFAVVHEAGYREWAERQVDLSIA